MSAASQSKDDPGVLMARELASHAARLDGRINLMPCVGGLHVHALDATARESFDVRFEAAPGAKIFIVLEGEMEVLIDGTRLVIGGGDSPIAELVALPERVNVVRRCRQGEHVRKALVTIDQCWFEAWESMGARLPQELIAFLGRPGAMMQWVPSARTIREAEAIIASPGGEGLAGLVDTERLALDIIVELVSLFETSKLEPIPRGDRRDRLGTVRQRLKETCSDAFSLSAFARDVGMSERSLQRAFQTSSGMSIGAYLRRCRLEKARDALIDEAVSITDAAAIAGYATPSSFTAAFTRLYGVPPSQMRSSTERRP